jgi:hypothetical protein
MIIALNSICMEGRHFAVLTSISFWSLTYLIAFIIISNKLSKDNLFTKIASKFKIYWNVFYISIQSYAFLMIIIYFICIGYFSGELSGKDSSCW